MKRARCGRCLTGALVVAGALLLWIGLRARSPEPAMPGYVPMGESVEHVVRSDEEGERVWTLSKQRLSLEELPDRVLPSPAPRSSEPDAERESARTLDALALDAWRRGEVLGAVDFFERAVAADPDDAVPRSNYGRFLILAEDYERALLHLARAAELSPDDAQVWLDLQTLYERSLLLERAFYARRRAESLTHGQEIRKDERGFYLLESTVFP